MQSSFCLPLGSYCCFAIAIAFCYIHSSATVMLATPVLQNWLLQQLSQNNVVYAKKLAS